MNKIVITITTDASLLTVNRLQNQILNEMLTGNFTIEEYTIQEARVNDEQVGKK